MATNAERLKQHKRAEERRAFYKSRRAAMLDAYEEMLANHESRTEKVRKIAKTFGVAPAKFYGYVAHGRRERHQERIKEANKQWEQQRKSAKQPSTP